MSNPKYIVAEVDQGAFLKHLYEIVKKAVTEYGISEKTFSNLRGLSNNIKKLDKRDKGDIHFTVEDTKKILEDFDPHGAVEKSALFVNESISSYDNEFTKHALRIGKSAIKGNMRLFREAVTDECIDVCGMLIQDMADAIEIACAVQQMRMTEARNSINDLDTDPRDQIPESSYDFVMEYDDTLVARVEPKGNKKNKMKP